MIKIKISLLFILSFASVSFNDFSKPNLIRFIEKVSLKFSIKECSAQLESFAMALELTKFGHKMYTIHGENCHLVYSMEIFMILVITINTYYCDCQLIKVILYSRDNTVKYHLLSYNQRQMMSYLVVELFSSRVDLDFYFNKFYFSSAS